MNKSGSDPGFFQDVIFGLSRPQKTLAPKYFYDDDGSRLFERICRLPEYYLTRAELSLTRANIGQPESDHSQAARPDRFSEAEAW